MSPPKASVLGNVGVGAVVILALAGVGAVVKAVGVPVDAPSAYTVSVGENHAVPGPRSMADVVTFTIHANQAQPRLRLGIEEWHHPLPVGGLSTYSVGTDAQITSVSGMDCRLDANAISCAIPAGQSTSVTVAFPINYSGSDASLFAASSADTAADWTEPQLG